MVTTSAPPTGGTLFDVIADEVAGVLVKDVARMYYTLSERLR